MWFGVDLRTRHHKDTCSKEIRLHAQNMLTILHSMLNTIGGDLYDHLMSTGIFTFIVNEIIII
jgi:hypothetical protein